MGILISTALRCQLLTPAVYSYLVRECLNLYKSTFRDIERHWQLDDEALFTLGVVSCPSEVTNLIASQACAAKFGELFDVPGFYLCNGAWWLDIDERLSQRGIILPIHNQRGWISSLKIFRHARDAYPFTLKLREVQAA